MCACGSTHHTNIFFRNHLPKACNTLPWIKNLKPEFVSGTLHEFVTPGRYQTQSIDGRLPPGWRVKCWARASTDFWYYDIVPVQRAHLVWWCLMIYVSNMLIFHCYVTPPWVKTAWKIPCDNPACACSFSFFLTLESCMPTVSRLAVTFSWPSPFYISLECFAQQI